ncbi:MAG: DUF2306 domain-containing protein [Saprospiraceae bacterium]
MKTIGKILFVILALGVGAYAFSFLDFKIKGILLNKGELIKNMIYLGAFYAHVTGGGMALIVGSFQFFPTFRNKYLSLHRNLGKIYVLACLFGGISGLGIAFFANEGPIAQIGFTLLALFWLFTTAQAYFNIRQKNIQAHKEWMLRSYAITFAAVSLRLQLPLYLIFAELDFTTAYRIVAWSCWVPNLLLIEWIIQKQVAPTTSLFTFLANAKVE